MISGSFSSEVLGSHFWILRQTLRPVTWPEDAQIGSWRKNFPATNKQTERLLIKHPAVFRCIPNGGVVNSPVPAWPKRASVCIRFPEKMEVQQKRRKRQLGKRAYGSEIRARALQLARLVLCHWDIIDTSGVINFRVVILCLLWTCHFQNVSLQLKKALFAKGDLLSQLLPLEAGLSLSLSLL